MDIATRLFANSIEFYDLWEVVPRFFSASYIFLFVGIFAIAAIGFVVTVITIRRQLKKSKKEPKEH